MCQAKANTGREKLQIKILPSSPDISCPISVHLNVYTDSCNRMLNKLSLRKNVQAQSKYLSMEAFMPPTWASIKSQQEQYISCELQNACGERASELGNASCKIINTIIIKKNDTVVQNPPLITEDQFLLESVISSKLKSIPTYSERANVETPLCQVWLPLLPYHLQFSSLYSLLLQQALRSRPANEEKTAAITIALAQYNQWH